ncbi:hypothetical protein T484DRAFT_1884664 [Baffinella frigidus]|nr:hypothetical protein T484DRAFT_1884664 [Cryptophyta sp. CCMP2293]
MTLRTTNAALQERLDTLVKLANEGNVEEFVKIFVPTDCDAADIKDFQERLKADGSEWKNLKEEIGAIAAGAGVQKILGNQTTKATFMFQHPTQEMCDREVAFVCEAGDWRAEG